MSNYEINNLDPDDIGLKEVMGNRFQDGTRQPMVEPFNTESTNTTQPKKKAQKPMDAQWEPVKQRNWKDDLIDCTKTTILFGGLNLLIWYWQTAGLMDESIALPCMLVCAALAGWGIGKCFQRGID
jgi:hypothetical protein